MCKYIQIRVFRAEILVRYRYALLSHARLSIWIRPNQRLCTWIQFSFFFWSLYSQKNGAKLTCCMIGGKLLISPCRKNAFFWFSEEILLFRAEILSCGPPLLPHSYAEPFLGVVQKYSFLGDIFTSAPSRIELHCTSKRAKKVAKSSPLKNFVVQELFVSNTSPF